MEFEWDEAKNRANIAKHGVGFDLAKQIFSGRRVTWVDDVEDHSEVREISIGLVHGVVLLVVIHTDRNGVIRIISARRALKHERKLYDETV